MNIDYEAGPADAETLGSDSTSQFGGKGDATSTRLHWDGADLEHNRAQQNLPSGGGRDEERARDWTQNRTQDQAPEPKLRRPSQKRKSPTEDDSHGLSFMISLGRRLSTSPAEAWASRIFQRIRCAHFHRLYMVAIEDARKGDKSSFFWLSDELLRRHGKAPIRRHGPGFGVSSAVKDRLVELILLDPRLRLQLSRDRCWQIIQDIEQNGKRWSRPIQRLGYEILLLIPDELSDRK